MTLKISVIDGPTQGEVHEFGDEVELVEIGRDPDHCKVVFPPNFTSIGRRHVSVRKIGGRYKLESNLQNPVLIDGRDAFDEEPLTRSQEVQLGRGGPRLKIETTFLNALPATDPGGGQLAPSARAARQRRALGGILAAVVVLVVALAGVAGYVYWTEYQSEQRLTALVAEMEKVDEDAPVAAPASNDLSPDTLATVAQSVYLVMIRDASGRVTPQATAWVVADGVLATNAHVAAIADELTPGQTLVVRGTTAPYDIIEIERAVKHPDWERFNAQWVEQSPVRVGAGESTNFVDLSYLGYDVGLLYAVPGSTLAPPLTIAAADTLTTLQAGEAIGFVGFPMEEIMGGGVNPNAPVPQVQVGHINALTDNFLMPGSDAERLLVQHSMISAGGASGSPIVDAAGEVVAVLSAGNYIFLDNGTRVPNASGIEYAQRADLVLELLDDEVEAVRPERDAFWQAGFATFDDPDESIPVALLAGWAADFPDIEPTQVGAWSGMIETAAGDGTLAVEISDAFTDRGFYCAIAISRSHQDIDLAFSADGTVLNSDTAYDWYPIVTWTLGEPQPVDIVVTAYTEAPVDYELQVWFIPIGRTVEEPAPAPTEPTATTGGKG
jgi:hypothetical protein